MSALDMSPGLTIGDVEDYRLTNPKAFCEAPTISRSTAGAEYLANLSHVIFAKFRAWIFRACVSLGILFMELLDRGACLLANMFRSCGMPRFTATRFLWHRVSAVVFTTALMGAASSFLVAIGHIVRLCSQPEMIWVYTQRVITGVADVEVAGLITGRQEVGDTVNSECSTDPVWTSPTDRAVTARRFSTRPNVAVSPPVRARPEARLLFFCHNWDRTIHYPVLRLEVSSV